MILTKYLRYTKIAELRCKRVKQAEHIYVNVCGKHKGADEGVENEGIENEEVENVLFWLR